HLRKDYYKKGYAAVRKCTSNAYEVLSNRLGPADPKELRSFAEALTELSSTCFTTISI
ncbi:Glycoside hydrolase, partial [Parasponia andersonii]